MSRRTIALLVSGCVKGIQDSIIEGVRSSCEIMDINLLVFNQLSDLYTITAYEKDQNMVGECMVFGLIPYDNIDGIIIDSRSFVDETVLKYIIDTARGKGIPAICLDDIQRGCLHMELDDEMGEAELIRHLIDEHGITRINFIGGMEGNEETEKRLHAYKQVLSEKNIPVEEERIGYGYFGVASRDVVSEFMQSNLPFPQAIACANDVMAMEVICELLENGYRVPEDVIVVGFDAYEEAQQFCPSITSVRRGITECGEMAVKQLYRLWSGKTVPLDTKIVPSIIYGQSCGCVPRNDRQLVKMYNYQHGMFREKRALTEAISGIAHYGFGGKNLREFLQRIEQSSKGFNYDEMWFCMEDEPVSLKLDEGEVIHAFGPLTVDGAYGASNQVGKHLSARELLPGFDISGQNLEKPYCYIFNPIYGRGCNLGYVARRISKPFSFKGFFRQWLGIISAYMTVYFFENEKVIKSAEKNE